MPKLAKVMEELSMVRQKRTVFEHLIKYLDDEFGERDEGSPPNAMKVVSTGEVVSQDSLTEAINIISDQIIGPLQVREVELCSADVDLGDEEETPKTKKVVKKSSIKKASNGG